MKHQSVVTLLLLFATSIGCTKSPDNHPATKADNMGKCYTGKIAYPTTCNRIYVVQILSEDKKGLNFESRWIEPHTKVEYRDVFVIANPCDLHRTFKLGDVFQFVPAPPKQDTCVSCYNYTDHPEKSMSIQLCSPVAVPF
ncbi:MAG: hypothetical protein ACJ75B_08155 [Flavisolibacter sp.]